MKDLTPHFKRLTELHISINALKFVKNTPLRVVFSSPFSVLVGNLVKHSLS